MVFTLTYEGPLPPRRKAVGSIKADLRRTFHPQLKERFAVSITDKTPPRMEIDGHQFIGIAHRRSKLAAVIEVLLLTPPALGKPGDPDNRVKTLIDGLTVPQNAQQVDRSHDSTDPDDPTLCLLQDDALARRVTIDSRPWLGQPRDQCNSLVVISVTLEADGGGLTFSDLGFIG